MTDRFFQIAAIVGISLAVASAPLIARCARTSTTGSARASCGARIPEVSGGSAVSMKRDLSGRMRGLPEQRVTFSSLKERGLTWPQVVVDPAGEPAFSMGRWIPLGRSMSLAGEQGSAVEIPLRC